MPTINQLSRKGRKRVLKKKGDRVKPAMSIAVAGKNLYFELRQAGKALNPVMWLKQR